MNTIKLLIFIIFLVVMVLMALNSPLPPALSLLTISLLLAALILVMMISVELPIAILILAMLFSPEISVGATVSRGIIIRFDDIFIILIFIIWLFKMAVNKQLGLLRHTSINLPIWTYIFICILSSISAFYNGIAQNRILSGAFFILKYLEYFCVYFFVLNNIKTEKQLKLFYSFLMFTYLAVCVYGYMQIFTFLPSAESGAFRITAPFEGKPGEPNTLSAYLMLLMSLALGGFLYENKYRLKLTYLALFLLGIYPLCYTLSRSGYMGFLTMCVATLLIARKKIVFLLPVIVILTMLLSYNLPVQVKNRISATFVGKKYSVGDVSIEIDGSARERVTSYKDVLEKRYPLHPFLGTGTASTFIDGQYFSVLAENGLFGLLAFFWIILAIFGICRKNLILLKKDNFSQGLIRGFLAGFIGLLVHALSANTFILIRVMEPFWFIVALIAALPLALEKKVSV